MRELAQWDNGLGDRCFFWRRRHYYQRLGGFEIHLHLVWITKYRRLALSERWQRGRAI